MFSSHAGAAGNQAVAFDLAYVANSALSIEATQSSYTFNSVPIGAANSERRTIVCVGGRAITGSVAPTITSVSIDALATTEVVQHTMGATNSWAIAGAFIRHHTSGTTAQIIVNFSETIFKANIAVFRMLNPSSNTAHQTRGVSGNPVNTTLTIPAGGGAIGHIGFGGQPLAWSGLTERYDEEFPAGFATQRFGGASDVFPTQQTDRAIDVTTSAGTNAVVLASWAPA